MNSLLSKSFFLTLLLAAVFAQAQLPRVDIPGSEVRRLKSELVKGQEYELQIMLPRGYSQGDQKYPVVYLMDSQWDFPLVSAIYGQQYYDGFVPALIIVGVTWGGTHPNPDSLRARDYTPTHLANFPQSGGAESFLSFMQKELFPFVEANYRADPANRVLMGCSLGGLFTLYALFTQPHSFKGYVAASPAIGWDTTVIESYENRMYSTAYGNPRLYLTVGDVERGAPDFQNFVSRLRQKKFNALSIASKVLENTGHSGTKSETYARGLQFVFQRAELKIPADSLERYTGVYTADDKSRIVISREKDKLVLYAGNATPIELIAEKRNEFYSTAEYLKLRFTLDGEKSITADLERFGGAKLYKKK